jgi:steroid 5-alpha reductase family enzyme
MTALASCAVALGIYTALWGSVALVKRDNSIADVAWGGGFVLLATTALVRATTVTPRAVLVTALVTAWAVRLSAYVLLRKRGKGEDFRYAAWRRTWGPWWVLGSIGAVYLLQAATLVVVAAPVLVATLRPSGPLGALDALGAAVWLTGFLVETVADRQLARFRAEPSHADRVLDRGLWAWSRHPNYFGEACLWWGIGLVGLSAPGGLLGLIGPAVMTLLLLRISGVPLLERELAARKPGYAAYVRRTSVFLPRPPRRAPMTDETRHEGGVRDRIGRRR